MQVKDTVRLNKNSQEILKSYYAEDVNKAIKDMFTQICHQNIEIEKLKAVVDTLQKSQTSTQPKVHWTSDGALSEHNETYWRKMKEVIISSVHELQR